MSIGGSASHSGTSKSKTDKGTTTSQLSLDQNAINKIIQDTLGGANGLASIFGAEQNSGIYNSSVANQAAGNLTANIIGELAKITGKTTTTHDNKINSNSNTNSQELNFKGFTL